MSKIRNAWDAIDDFLTWHTGIAAIVIMLFGIISAAVAFVLVSHIRINTGEKQYTGYIYAAEDEFDMTVGHLRFSETAGEDAQPDFCVEKKDGQQIKDLAGSGKKVKVTVPAGYKFVGPWVCAFPATIEEM